MPMKTLLALLAIGLLGCRNAVEGTAHAQSNPPASTQPAQQPPSDPAKPAAPAAQPPAAPPGPQLDPAVDDLLTKLEKSATDLNSFTADVTYEKEDVVLGRRELRTGNLIYRLNPDNSKSFAILFDSTIVNDKKRAEEKHYIFNGRWLAEVDHKNKQFIKREVVPPGKQLDPLKLGEGPFPLPVGQPKAQVLARFDVTKADLPKEGRLKDLRNVDGLLLVPKPGGPQAQDFAKVELFYDRETLLPVGIHTVEANGDHKTIRLTKVQRNPVLDAAALAKLDIKEPDAREWRIDVRPWQQQQPQ